MSKTVLVTGSAGFIGSHFVDHILKNTDWRIVGFDSFRHRGDSTRVQHDGRYEIHTLDLAAPISHRVMEMISPIDYVVNFASESHVDRSIEEPRPFIENNVSLMLSMLELSRKMKPSKFIHISTDEVYGAAPEGVRHEEWSTILPSNPYSASKAAQEAIAISYWRTYEVPLIIANSMNLFGEKQDCEKFIPMTIANIVAGRTVTIHGSYKSIGSRFYQHARNMADALLFLLREKNPTRYVDGKIDRPDRFNVVGEVEVDNRCLAQKIADILGLPLHYQLEDFHKSRPGHDRRYALCDKKLANFGWEQPRSFDDSLASTVNWYLKNKEWLGNL